jgi:hypothetical protein
MPVNASVGSRQRSQLTNTSNSDLPGEKQSSRQADERLVTDQDQPSHEAPEPSQSRQRD